MRLARTATICALALGLGACTTISVPDGYEGPPPASLDTESSNGTQALELTSDRDLNGCEVFVRAFQSTSQVLMIEEEEDPPAVPLGEGAVVVHLQPNLNLRLTSSLDASWQQDLDARKAYSVEITGFNGSSTNLTLTLSTWDGTQIGTSVEVPKYGTFDMSRASNPTPWLSSNQAGSSRVWADLHEQFTFFILSNRS